jgi:hypothetical protein
MKALVKRLFSNEGGQDVAEYGIILALIFGACCRDCSTGGRFCQN